MGGEISSFQELLHEHRVCPLVGSAAMFGDNTSVVVSTDCSKKHYSKKLYLELKNLAGHVLPQNPKSCLSMQKISSVCVHTYRCVLDGKSKKIGKHIYEI